jgi:hypothetical protein
MIKDTGNLKYRSRASGTDRITPEVIFLLMNYQYSTLIGERSYLPFTLVFGLGPSIQIQYDVPSKTHMLKTQPLGQIGFIGGGPPHIWFRIDERFMIGYVPSNDQFLFGWLDLKWNWNGGVKKPFNGDSREVIGVWISPNKETSGVFHFGKRSVAGFELGAIGQLFAPEQNGTMKVPFLFQNIFLNQGKNEYAPPPPGICKNLCMSRMLL